MKRSPPQTRRGFHLGDVSFDLLTGQFIMIGKVAMIYNLVEARVKELCGEGLRIPIQPADVISRINGIEGVVNLIKLSAAHWGFDAEQQKFLAGSLGDAGFMLLKRWRDGVIHARVWDSKTGVARVSEKQGRVSEVLLSEEALQGLYMRLEWLHAELWSLLQIMTFRSQLALGGIDDQRRLFLEQVSEDEWAQARERRTGRLSLPPMPEFPENIPDPRLPEATQ